MVLLLFVLNFTFLFAENWTYKMEALSIPTGKSENEIYIYDAPDHLVDCPDEGPTKFQIDEIGNIYILDGKKIKKFDKKGNFIFSTQKTKMNFISFVVLNDTIWASCRDYRNDIFLRSFDQNGHIVHSFLIEKQLSQLKVNQNGKIGFILGDYEFLEYEIREEQLFSKTGNILKNIILDFNWREHRKNVIIPEENIKLDLNEIWTNEVGHSLIGFDEVGNLYFNLYSKPADESKLGIISYSGEVIETNVIFPFYEKFGLIFTGGPESHMSINGDIYQMIPMKDKVEIKKWTRVE